VGTSFPIGLSGFLESGLVKPFDFDFTFACINVLVPISSALANGNVSRRFISGSLSFMVISVYSRCRVFEAFLYQVLFANQVSATKNSVFHLQTFQVLFAVSLTPAHC
jgi:hypothetical protein